jgi:hypothetical protein
MTQADRWTDFWGLATWISIGYFVLFVAINVAGLIWVKKTSDAPPKKVKETIDWGSK